MKIIDQKKLNANYPNLAKAREGFNTFVVVDAKPDPDFMGVVLLQIRFPNGKYGLCIYSETMQDFVEEPDTYEGYETTEEAIEDKYAFGHDYPETDNIKAK